MVSPGGAVEMANIVRIAENMEVNLDTERWLCAKCGHECGSARENMKYGLLVAERDPTEIHRPLIDNEINFAPNPEWIRILEFYCPGCGVQMETEYLPPGHPITNTTEIDIDSLKRRLADNEIEIVDKHIQLVQGDAR